MNIERLIKLSLAILLIITPFGCISSQPTNSKSSPKASNVTRKKNKIKTEKDTKKKDDEDTNKETANSSDENGSQQIMDSQQATNDDSAQSSSDEPSDADTELLNMANSRIHDYWHDYYCFMAGTYFSYDSGQIGNYCHINDPRIHSLRDVEDVWYEKFSKKYPIIYNDENQNPYKKQAFIQKDDGVYELYQIDGLAIEFYFDHITQRTADEVWFACYCKGPDGSTSDTGQTWSFVYEDGTWKYGQITKN